VKDTLSLCSPQTVFQTFNKNPIDTGTMEAEPKLSPLIKKKQGFVQLDLDLAFMTTSSDDNEPFIPSIKLKLMGFFHEAYD